MTKEEFQAIMAREQEELEKIDATLPQAVSTVLSVTSQIMVETLIDIKDELHRLNVNYFVRSINENLAGGMEEPYD